MDKIRLQIVIFILILFVPVSAIYVKASSPLLSSDGESWYMTFGSSIDEEAVAATIDDEEDIYIAYNRGDDIHILGYDSGLGWIGNKSYDSGGPDSAIDIVVDSSKNFFVTANGLRVIKFDSLGNEVTQAAISVIGGAAVYLKDVIVDSNDNVFIVGNNGSVRSDTFITKFNNNLVQAWHYNINYPGSSIEPAGIAVDSSDNIYVTGNTGSHLLVLFKFSTTGVQQWNTTIMDLSGDKIHHMIIDSSDNIYYSGGVGASDFLLVKTDNSGNLLWKKGTAKNARAFGTIALDSSENIILTGGILDSTDGGVVWRDIYSTQFAPNGGVTKKGSFGLKGLDDYASDVIIDSQDNIFLIGSTESYGAGGYDVILIKNMKMSSSSGASIPGYDLIMLLGGIGVISGIILQRQKSLKK